MKYKAGDKVRIKSLDWYNENKNPDYGFVYLGNGICFYSHMSNYCGKTMTISEIFGHCYRMAKCVYDNWTDEMIEGLVEEETKPNIIEEAKTYWDSIKDTWICPEGYQFVDENGNVINATKIVLEKKKKEYPKTYVECYKIIGIQLSDCYIQGYKSPLLEDLQELLICRDVYWKIAGEEMGLKGPWEPDWNTSEPKYVIACTNNGIEKQWETTYCKVFAFPTEEMRDEFYENFKELINECKELL